MHVFGKGMLDTLDDVFWMLPFSSKKQADIVRQENNLTDEDWLKRRDQITAEHRLEGARDQLRTQWKEWIKQDASKDSRDQLWIQWKEWIKQDASKDSSQTGPRAPAADHKIPAYDEQICK